MNTDACEFSVSVDTLKAVVGKQCKFNSSKWCGWDSCTFLYGGRVCFCKNYQGSGGGFTRRVVGLPHISLQNKHCGGDISDLVRGRRK